MGHGGTRDPLPRGTVTLLLTDVEGSTEMWERAPDAAAAAMRRHRELLDEVIAGHGGVRPVEQGEGDSVVAGFAHASDAVATALMAQRRLLAEPWPGGLDLRVRMGLHTGEPLVPEPGQYAGPVIIRAARIRNLGRGGQILLSEATRNLIADAPAPGAELVSAGEFPLKGLNRPEPLYALQHPDLPTELPLPRPAPQAPHEHERPAAWPRPTAPLIGRDGDVAALLALLRRPETRLVTVTGTGGVGKTSLVAEVGRRLVGERAGAAIFVDLAPVEDPAHLPSTILGHLGAPPTPGVAPASALAAALRTDPPLLVLDNFEQVLAGAGLLVDLLEAAPDARFLVTSRAALDVPGEHRYPVAPLALPTGGAVGAVAGAPASRLFIDRARARDPTFAVNSSTAAAIADVCRRLEGLPLAIELAAASCDVLSPEELAERIDPLLTDVGATARAGAPARQRTLRAMLDWSASLVTEAERAVLARLSVFAGGCGIQAALDVAGATVEEVRTLVGHSLVLREADDGETRLRLLEPVRHYALELLGDDDAMTRNRHADWYLRVAEALGPQVMRHGHGRALDQLVREQDNLNAVLEWTTSHPGDERGLRLVAALAYFWHATGQNADGVRWADAVLGPESDDDEAQALARLYRGLLGVWIGRAGERDILAAHRTLRHSPRADVLCRAETAVSHHHSLHENYAEAEQAARRAVAAARAADDRFLEGLSLGALARADRDFRRGLPLVQEATAMLESVGASHEAAEMLSTASFIALQAEDYGTARELAGRAATAARANRDPMSLAYVLGNDGLAALFEGDVEHAGRAFGEQLELASRIPVRTLLLSEAMLGLSAVAAALGEDRRAARLASAVPHVETMATPVDLPVYERLIQRFLDPAGARLGIETWELERAAGAAMPTGELRRLALDER